MIIAHEIIVVVYTKCLYKECETTITKWWDSQLSRAHGQACLLNYCVILFYSCVHNLHMTTNVKKGQCGLPHFLTCWPGCVSRL